MLLFCAIVVPDFPVASVARLETFTEKPVAILEGEPPATRVRAANEKARALGMEIGMTKLQAEALSAVTLRKRSLAQEAAAQAALLDCAQAFSPRVEDTAPGTVTLDIAGLENLFGPPGKIAREIARRVSDIGMDANVAVAPNPDAAMHAARGFAGITVLDAGNVAARLGTLPLDVLQPAPTMMEMLDSWGVRTLHALAILPPIAISQRLGQEGLRLQRLARGEEQRTLVPAPAAFNLSEAYEFEDPVELLEPLAFIMARLLEQICTRLSARALATNELRIDCDLDIHHDRQIKIEPQSTESYVEELNETKNSPRLCASAVKTQYERRLRLPVPMLNRKVFLKLLQLEVNAHPPQWPVKKMTITAEPVPPRSTQSGFFVPRMPEPERLEVMLARVRGIVGEGRVGSPVLLDTHRPDGFRMERFGTTSGRGPSLRAPKRGSAQDDSRIFADDRRLTTDDLCLRRVRPPSAIKVQLRDGIPACLFINGKPGEVVSAAGPWRSSGVWWTSAPWSREEWDVAVKSGEQFVVFRIFRDRVKDEWFVDGSYD